jgi:hypothetical protein
MVLTTVMVLVATQAFAITAPTGGFAQDVYDIFVTKMLKGPIGFVAGCVAIIFGAVMAIRAQIMTAIPAVIGGAVMLKADAVVESLGALLM